MSDLVLPRTRSLLLVAFVIAAFSSYLAVQVERDSNLSKPLFDLLDASPSAEHFCGYFNPSYVSCFLRVERAIAYRSSFCWTITQITKVANNKNIISIAYVYK